MLRLIIVFALVALLAVMMWAPIPPAATADPTTPNAGPVAAPAPAGGLVIFLPLVERNAATQGPTPTPAPLSFVLSGLVYDVSAGPGRPIAGANVSVSVCQTRAFDAVSNADGRYTLSIPIAELNTCPQVTLGAAAVGYSPQYTLIAIADLLADQQRDFGLTPLSGPQPTPIPGPW